MANLLANTMTEERIGVPNGLEILVRSWRPDGPARAVMVICHGFNSHSGYYLWVAEQFAARGLAVYALDLHGRGKSDGCLLYTSDAADE